VGSRLVEHHQLPHAPGVGDVPAFGDLAVRLGEEPVNILVSVIPPIQSPDMRVDVVTLDRVDIESSRTKLPHLGYSYVAVKLSSAMY